MQAIIDVFSYINSLGASVMMPIILTIIGVVLGAKFGKALRGGQMCIRDRHTAGRTGYFGTAGQ